MFHVLKKEGAPKVIVLFLSPLRNHKNVTLTLSWNVVPNAGTLPRLTSLGSHSFKFPSEYTTSKAV